MNISLKIILFTSSVTLLCACNPPQEIPKTLVHKDGSYDQVPLEKDTAVVKIVQAGVDNIQEFDDHREALNNNLNKMISYAKKACSTGKKPDFILYNEFPLTGYSFGDRQEKLKYTIKIPGPETQALGKVAQECDTYIIFGSKMFPILLMTALQLPLIIPNFFNRKVILVSYLITNYGSTKTDLPFIGPIS